MAGYSKRNLDIGRQFEFARIYRGYTQSGLAKAIKGLSQPNLSNFEKGIPCLSEETRDRMIEYLGFPRSFFYNVVIGQKDIFTQRYRYKITNPQTT